ncbi:hypothetical protein BOTBODRAFT_65879 [Botryobasidium botryosum FD-172 SS1]|uniref:MICOS complex subunit MIC60 n=1 Tax=Botryobasidium botryosum (strain FD-172 SS1) TaxID=930990 RepID=A0A067MTQ2_BOTB1|nr:hypothetical protein BOTBODRAFT_65879 [Botryobasidium botryosum FD-172 SS1]
MYRNGLPVCRQVVAVAARPAPAVARFRLVRKKRGVVRSLLLYSTVFGVVFYGGSTVVALTNERFHDFFVESVPLGEPIIEYAESQGWDQIFMGDVGKKAVAAGKGAYRQIEGAVSRSMGSAPPAPPPKEAPPQTTTREKLKGVADTLKTKVEKTAPTKEVNRTIEDTGIQFSAGVEELVREVESVLRMTPENLKALFAPTASTSVPESKKVEDAAPTPGKKIYTGALPLGFEPPPGFSLPSKPKEKKPAASAPAPSIQAPEPPLPLVAPAVVGLSASEPVIAHLASTIDSLTTYLSSSTAGSTTGAKDVLHTAQADLIKLAERIDKAKEEERKKLEEKLDQQAREYTASMVEMELDAQDKLDRQEEDWKSLFDEERERISKAYRAKLEAELATQSEIINQRLKEEVIAQGIEMQRRWIREIKVRVEQERGGRLAKLDELATGLKRLERLTIDNNSYIDENRGLHKLWSAFRALSTASVEARTRQPFREELRVLKSVAALRDDAVIATALESLEKGDTADIGVEPLADLASWFTTSVSSRVEGVALVPDQNAGLLSHVASSVLSAFRFRRQGNVEGSDVLSVVARAEHYLNEKDLDSAARELNQLTGWPKKLASDWLAAARRRLEVQQALEVIRAQATLATLLVV